MAKDVRVRFAPSPTGHLHIGGARSALFNYLFARNQGGQFILRIEDTDQQRNVDQAEEKLLSSLRWLGVEWDESVDVGGSYGPYRSMDRIEIYQRYINQLIEEEKAYYCFCTAEELEREREKQMASGETPKYAGTCRHLSTEIVERYRQEGRPASVRFRVLPDQQIVVNDLIRGSVSFDSNGTGDFVIVRPDGAPTYNFAVTIDDHLMRISHVIRGDEHLSNTPRQLMIYEALGFEAPEFAHVSLILNEDRQKMSKRDESIVQFVEQYRDLGYLPEALLNFLALLGWAPEKEEEIFTKEQLIEQFSLSRISKSPSVFDREKLNWMNNHYLKQQPVERIVELCLPHLQAAGYASSSPSAEQMEWITKLVKLYQEQLSHAAEIVQLASLFFKDEIEYEEEANDILTDGQAAIALKSFLNEVEAMSEFNPQDIKQALKNTQKSTGLKGKSLFMPVRAATTGQTHGRDLNETISLLGKDTVSNRLQAILSRIENT